MGEVVIIGAGPVGLMLACELSLAGVVPVVLDKRAEPGELPKANGLGGQIVELLDHRGLLERLSEGSPFCGVPPGFPFGSVPLRFAGVDGIPLRMLVIQQPRLERLLGERAVELGVRIRWGHELTSLTQHQTGVTLEGAGFRLDARYVVGCDGGRSRVRELAGIDFPGTTDDEVLRLGHFTTDTATDVFDSPEVAGLRPGWNRTPRGRLIVTSLQPGVHIVGVREKGTPTAGPVTLAEFEAAVRRVVGRDLPLGEPTWLSSTVAQARLAGRYREGRVFLAGDAAHLFPAGGSSLNIGMTDAINLGWKLAARLRGRGPKGLLDTYESERRPAAERALMQTRAQAALDRLEGEDGEALRALLTEVFADEQPLRHLADLLHGSDTRSGKADHPLVGRLVPDLPLTTETGARRVAELMRQARPVLLDLGAGAPLDGDCDDWIDVVRARCDNPPADTLLIRPDGYVAWAGTEGLTEAITRWFDPQPANE
ncbi:FAD-dependent monooxygenase [Amycolatopsis nigrescens]|uniref:FAD-dependent monooxygenase n=1 Tax=Amycolatopsis nigrescens TaxID=381445 RepID=UPI0003819B85|nr:FAD-dependent monooxygenase [Amycolatopsis nigrescens]